MNSTSEKSLRGWQADALPAIFEHIDERPLVRAVMGSGKSVLIAELVRHVPVHKPIVVTTPTVRLVDDLADTLEWWTDGEIQPGKYYTHAKDVRQVTVVCNASMPAFVRSPEFAALQERLGRVELWIADEAHRTNEPRVKDSLPKLNPYRRVGFSATPWLADENARLTEFETLAFNYTAAQAIQDGVVVPFRLRHYRDRNKKHTLNEACALAISGAKSRNLGPGLVNARNIADAEEFATYLRQRAGVKAKAVHSEMGRDEEQRRIDALREGELDCLVHVDMLAEGVNLPWLRWLCCRRPVGSKVRFAQEVGRVLRAHPGKEYATIFDPHDLFGCFQLDDKVVLDAGGEIEGDDPLEFPAKHLDFLCDQIKEDPEPPETYHGVPVQLIDPTASYVRKLSLQLQFAGHLEPELKSRHWRSEPPSVKQVDLVRRFKPVLERTADIPPTHKKALEVAIAAAPGLRKGDVSDLIGVLLTLKKMRVWPGWVEVDAEDAAANEKSDGDGQEAA